MLRITVGPEMKRVIEGKGNCIKSSFMICTLHHAGCSCAHTSSRMQWTEIIEHERDAQNAYRIVFSKSEENT
jgi:hypothetical protein